MVATYIMLVFGLITVICLLYWWISISSLKAFKRELIDTNNFLENWDRIEEYIQQNGKPTNDLDLIVYGENIFDIEISPAAFAVNESSILGKLHSLRRVAIEHAPSIFTALGIFFTFVGLVVALKGLSVEGSAEDIAGNISRVMEGIGPAFWSSIFGIFLSVFSLIVSRNILSGISKICGQIREQAMRLRVPQSPEELLFKMAQQADAQTELLRALSASTEKQATSLEALPESIATTLKETVGDPLNTTLDQIGDKINQSVETNLDTIVEAFREAFDSFTESFSSAATSQYEQMKEAFEDVTKWHEQTRDLLDKTWQNLDAHVTKYSDLLDTQNNTFNEQQEFERKKAKTLNDNINLLIGYLTTFESSLESFETQQSQTNETVTELKVVNEALIGQLNLFMEADAQFAGVMDQARLDFVAEINTLIDTLKTTVGEFSDKATQSFGELGNSFNQLLTDHASKLTESSNALSEKLDLLLTTDSAFATSINDTKIAMSDDLVTLKGQVKDSLEEFQKDITHSLAAIKSSHEDLMKQYIESINDLPNHAQIMSSVSKKLNTGLEGTFSTFDTKTSEIVKHLAFTYNEINDGIANLNTTLSEFTTTVSDESKRRNGASKATPANGKPVEQITP